MKANIMYSKELNNAPFANNCYLDTGAINHATPNATILQRVEEYTSSNNLRVGNGAGLNISSIVHTSISSSSTPLLL